MKTTMEQNKDQDTIGLQKDYWQLRKCTFNTPRRIETLVASDAAENPAL